MKTQEEIEQLAKEFYLKKAEAINNSITKGFIVSASKGGFIQGYTQCQEDMADKKYAEEDMLKCWNTAFTDAMNIDSETYKPIFYSDFINSLNKQG
jgi:hypothetical protein